MVYQVILIDLRRFTAELLRKKVYFSASFSVLLTLYPSKMEAMEQADEGPIKYH